MSYISDGVPELIQIASRAKKMHDAYGMPIFDKPMQKWPGKWVELFEILEDCRIEEHNARVLKEIEVSSHK